MSMKISYVTIEKCSCIFWNSVPLPQFNFFNKCLVLLVTVSVNILPYVTEHYLLNNPAKQLNPGISLTKR